MEFSYRFDKLVIQTLISAEAMIKGRFEVKSVHGAVSSEYPHFSKRPDGVSLQFLQ